MWRRVHTPIEDNRSRFGRARSRCRDLATREPVARTVNYLRGMETTFTATVPGIGTFQVPAIDADQARERIVEFLADPACVERAFSVDPRFVEVQ